MMSLSMWQKLTAMTMESVVLPKPIELAGEAIVIPTLVEF